MLCQSPCVGAEIEAESKFGAAQQMYSIPRPLGQFRTSAVGSPARAQKPEQNAHTLDKVAQFPAILLGQAAFWTAVSGARRQDQVQRPEWPEFPPLRGCDTPMAVKGIHGVTHCGNGRRTHRVFHQVACRHGQHSRHTESDSGCAIVAVIFPKLQTRCGERMTLDTVDVGHAQICTAHRATPTRSTAVAQKYVQSHPSLEAVRMQEARSPRCANTATRSSAVPMHMRAGHSSEPIEGLRTKLR